MHERRVGNDFHVDFGTGDAFDFPATVQFQFFIGKEFEPVTSAGRIDADADAIIGPQVFRVEVGIVFRQICLMSSG